MALSPDGKLLASTGHDWGGTVQLWDLEAGKRSAILAGGEPGRRIQVTNLAFSPDGTTLATLGGEDRRLRLWDVAGAKLLRAFGEPPDFYSMNSLAFSPDGRTLVTAGALTGDMESPGELRLWDVASGRSLGRYLEHSRPITCVAFSPDGETLATGSWDGAEPVKLRDVRELGSGGRPRPGAAPRND
jgi:WD40 repeat protein